MTEKGKLAVQPVILCGGSGTRLWPLSRSGFPKQFLCLTGEDSHRLFNADSQTAIDPMSDHDEE